MQKQTCLPLIKKLRLEVLGSRLEGVVGGKLIERVIGVDEFGDRRMSLKVMMRI